MKKITRSAKSVIPAALLSVPILLSGFGIGSTSAAEKKSIFNLKLIILNSGQYESSYDTNEDGKTNVFDVIRLKQNQYGLTEEITSAPETTTVTTTPAEVSATTTTVPVTTTSVITAPTTIVTTTTTVQTTTTTTAQTTTAAPPVTTVVTTNPPAPVTTPQRKILTNMKSMLQNPELPSGCEATGLTIAINWYGYSAWKTDIALNHMPWKEFYDSPDGRVIGADYRTTFAGDPRKTGRSYGCYTPCMETTVNSFFRKVGSPYKAKDITGTEFEDLLKYVARGIPVTVISTPELITPRPGDSWYTEDGRYITWQRGHHCMVIMGYDWSTYTVYCADPMMLKGIVSYNMTKFKTIYNLKGKNALIIDTGSAETPYKTAAVGDTVQYAGFFNSLSSGKGSEWYRDSSRYTVTQILSDTSLPCRVRLGNEGWVSYDSLIQYLPNNTNRGSINNNVYNIRNYKSFKNINVHYGVDADGTNIYQWDFDNSIEQLFKLVPEGDAYKIYSMCSSTGTNRVLTASSIAEGANVYLYSRYSNANQQWVIKKTKDTGVYYIALKSNPNYALTIANDLNGEKYGTSNTSPGNVFISKYTGASSQLWLLD